jgi:hypothetical protein
MLSVWGLQAENVRIMNIIKYSDAFIFTIFIFDIKVDENTDYFPQIVI